MLTAVDTVSKAAAVCAGLTTVALFLGGILSRTRKTLDGVRSLQKHVTENYMSTLQLTIMSECMPLPERLKAGEKYINLGGNGAVKCKYRELQREYEESLR